MSQFETNGFGKGYTFEDLKHTSALNTRSRAVVFNLHRLTATLELPVEPSRSPRGRLPSSWAGAPGAGGSARRRRRRTPASKAEVVEGAVVAESAALAEEERAWMEAPSSWSPSILLVLEEEQRSLEKHRRGSGAPTSPAALAVFPRAAPPAGARPAQSRRRYLLPCCSAEDRIKLRPAVRPYRRPPVLLGSCARPTSCNVASCLQPRPFY